MTTTKQLRRWLISVARPVLKPLGASIVFRHVDQLAGLALLAISAGAVTKVAGNALGAPASETAWLPNTAAMLAVRRGAGIRGVPQPRAGAHGSRPTRPLRAPEAAGPTAIRSRVRPGGLRARAPARHARPAVPFRPAWR